MKNRFNISFEEFNILVSVAIPPRPIARAMFWDDVINKHYNVLTETERARLYEWINRNHSMQDGIEKENEDCLFFNARYNPDNQYKIHTNYNNEDEIHDAFKWGERYYVAKDRSIEDKYITDVIKVSNKD